MGGGARLSFVGAACAGSGFAAPAPGCTVLTEGCTVYTFGCTALTPGCTLFTFGCTPQAGALGSARFRGSTRIATRGRPSTRAAIAATSAAPTSS